MTKVLIICRHNNIRSPAAEQIMRQIAHKEGYSGLEVTSAGLDKPLEYEGMVGEMEGALRTKGYDPGFHKPRQVTRELLLKQNLVLCMSHTQVERVLRKAPGLEGIVHTLPEYAGFGDEEVVDPHEIIREDLWEIPIFFILRHMPYAVREWGYRRLGHVDPSNDGRVMRVHVELVEQIEKYVNGAYVNGVHVEGVIGRMLRERLISVPETTPELSGLLS